MPWGKTLMLWGLLATVTAFATLRQGGPYDMTLTRLENCSEPDSGDVLFDIVKTKKNTRWAAFVGSVILKNDIDENVSMDITIYYKTGAGYSKAHSFFCADACIDAKRQFYEMAMLLLTGFGINAEECPIKAGVYKAELNTTFPPVREFPALFYGDFEAVFVFEGRNPRSRIGCFTTYFTVSERPLS